MLNRILYRFSLILAIAVPGSALAQEMDIAATAGYGTYNLKELKAHRTELLSAYPVELKVTDDFPAFYIFGGSLRFRVVDIPLAFSMRSGSTGSRASYSDYSGSVVIDQQIKFTSLGAEVGTLFHRSEKLDVEGLLRYWFNFTEIDFISDVEINDGQAEHNRVDLESLASSFTPTVMVSYKMKFVKLFFDAGYELYIPAKITLATDKELHLIDSQNKKVKFDGSGLRLNVGVAVRLIRDEY